MTSTRSLLLIGGGVALLAVLAVAVVLLAGDREAPQFAEDTPEGVLQRYLTAFDDGDLETAYGLFSRDVRDRMEPDAWERTIDMYEGGYAVDRTRRALFDGRSGDGDTVRLEVTVEELMGDGLGASTSRYQREIRMVREDGTWRIDEPLVWLEPAPIEPTR